MNAIQTEVSDGSLVSVNVGLEYFEQSDISVFLDQSTTPLVDGTDYQWANATRIDFLAGPIANGVTVTLVRNTQNEQMLNIYDGGAPFTRYTLDENFLQLLRLSQEFSEGLGLTGLRQALDMHGYRIFNLGDPENPADAATKKYIDNLIAELVEAGEGPIASAVNVSYLAPSGALTNLQALSGTLGSALIGHGDGVVGDFLPRYFDYYGPCGTADDTAVMQAALSSGYPRLVAKAGTTYKFTALTMATDGQQIVIEPAATLEALTPTAKSITITGQRCKILGPGTIKGQPTFDGANVRPTYGTLWVQQADYFCCEGVTFDTTPKEAIMLEDSTYARIAGNRFIGRYPQSSYDENTTTNHCAIMQNIPASASRPDPYLHVIDNTFEEYIQGMLVANYGAAGSNRGILIAGNNFKNCWDHGIYMSRGLGHAIVGNNFLSCRRPIVSDGIGSIVVGNVLMAGSTTASNREQIISVREPSNCVIANNSIYGYDASILVDCLETTTMDGNLIMNNSIRSTGTALVTCGIRLGVGATQCDGNSIIGNKITSDFFGATGAGIELTMSAGFANRTRVMNNEVHRGDVGGFGINAFRHAFCEIKNNLLSFSGTAGVATTTTGIIIDNATFPLLEGNTFQYTTGGANVTFRAFNVGSGCAVPKIYNNKLLCTSGTLTAVAPYLLAVTCDVRENLLNPNVGLSGSFTWPTATPSFGVVNANITATSMILVIPRNAGAGVVMRDLGFFVTPSLGGFTISTSAGVNTTAASNWDYVIM